MAVTGAITTGFKDENGVDLGRQLVEKDYLISVYPNLMPNMKAPGLFAWGTGTSGEFGNNAASSASSPTQVLIGSSVWKQVSGGYNHAAAIAIDGTLWAWGLGTSGQLGNGIAGHRSSPIQTISFGTNWSVVSNSGNHVSSTKSDGTLWTWGLGTSGQLGDGTIVTKSSPVQTAIYAENWSSVAGGGYHTAAIKTDGTLWTWGNNYYGQLGDNTGIAKQSPIQTITFATNWSSVAAGGNYYTAAIKTDGTLWTWGYNIYGLLGDNTINKKSSPVQTVAYGTNWSKVACGQNHTAAIKTDGTLWTWGLNTNGQLGDNTTVHRSSPAQVVGFATNWSSVAGGFVHTAAIKTDGTLWSWGDNSSGQLGDNTKTNRSSPIQTIAFGTIWSSVACGSYYTAGIKTDGTLWTWGNNSNGKLGDNTTVHRSSPIQTITFGTTWSFVACGNYHTAGIKTDGTFWTWGKNYPAGLGDNTRIHRSSPVQTVAFGTIWSKVSAGYGYTAGIKTDGTLWNWGIGTVGQLGDNTFASKSIPVQPLAYAFSTNWSTTSAGATHTSAIKKDGTLWSWGLGTSGQLGNNTATSTSVPVQEITYSTTWSSLSAGTLFTGAIKTNTLWLWGLGTSGQLGDNTVASKSSPVQTVTFGSTWSSVSCGATHVASVKTDGTLWLWGNNSYGQLGDNTVTLKSSPIQTITFGTTWSKVSAGYGHTGAIKTDGTAWTWGLGTSGQLGDATIVTKSSPVQVVVYAENWSSVGNGYMHTAAIKTDGTLWTWGDNTNGNLGDNTTIHRSSPVQTVVFGTSWSKVKCGYRYAAAIKTDGTIWTWGRNNQGQLGDGTVTHRSSPVQVVGFANTWSSVACGDQHTAAIKTDGTLWLWGRNSYGGLGDNTITIRVSPVQTITGGTNWSAVASGYSHTAGIKTDGTLWTWGRNSYGQLGDSTATNRSSPVQVVGFATNWSSVNGGNRFTNAIKTDGTLWSWGDNNSGQLGSGSTSSVFSPVQTSTFGTTWSVASAGGNTAFAIKKGGTLWSWGSNGNGKLGKNEGVDQSVPANVFASVFATNWSNISCGAINTVATRTNGTLWMWGSGTNGSLGNNLTTTTSLPIQNFEYATNWSQTNFSAPSRVSGSSTTTAIKTDGTLWVWGNNASGQLANTLFPVSRSSPNQTLDYSDQWQQVTGGSTHTMAIKQDGTLWGFGLNSEGEIGINNTSFMISPIQEVTGSSWKQVAAGFRFSAAIKANNTLWIWGRNLYGNLGDNTTVSKSSPVQEITGGSWAQIACGSYHIGGVKTDGTLWMWGLNTSGQLGDSTTTHRSSPVQTVAGGTNWKQVACGSGTTSVGHTACIKTDGTLWVWGNGNNGRLGDNTATSKSSPVQTITGGTNWRQVICTAFTVAATKTDGSLWSWGLSGVIGDNTAVSKSSPVQTAIGDKSWKNITIGNMGLATYAIRDWSY